MIKSKGSALLALLFILGVCLQRVDSHAAAPVPSPVLTASVLSQEAFWKAFYQMTPKEKEGLFMVLLEWLTPERRLELWEQVKVKETLGNLSAFASSVHLYHGANKQTYPDSLESLYPKYLDHFRPEAITGSTRTVKVFDGKGGWVYDPSTGRVRINLERYKNYE